MLYHDLARARYFGAAFGCNRAGATLVGAARARAIAARTLPTRRWKGGNSGRSAIKPVAT